MTYISRKTRLLVPQWLDECDPEYLYHLNKKRSDGRLKRHSSCDDPRAWVQDDYLNYQHLLELMTDEEEKPFLGLMGRFIPIDTILDLLCGSAWRGGNDTLDVTRDARLEPKSYEADLNASKVTADDIFRITNAAMMKLENISNILNDSDDEDRCPCNRRATRDRDSQISSEIPESSEADGMGSFECDVSKDKFDTDQNSQNEIRRLREKLTAIRQRRDELKAKIQAPSNSTHQSSSAMSVKQLYSREDHSQLKFLERMIMKLLEVLGHNVKKRRKCKTEKSSGSLQASKPRPFRQVSIHEKRLACRKYAESCRMLEETTKTTSKEDSSYDVSCETASQSDNSQATFNIPARKGFVPNRKFRSDTSMTAVEQTLRSYEQRLGNMECLELQVETLKKKAGMANYFKTRWLRSSVRGWKQKSAEKDARRQLGQLCAENNELKKMLQKVSGKSEKDQAELQHLRYKQKRMGDMEEEMRAMKKELAAYQMSCEKQRECIGRLEDTVREQAGEIEELLSQINMLRQRLRENGKLSKVCVPRSRSYGPENKRTGHSRKLSTLNSSDEEVLHPACSYCAQNCSGGGSSRPRSECGRRISNRGGELYCHQPTCRRLSGYH